MRTLIAAMMLSAVALMPGPADASLCYAFVEDLRRDLPGVRYAQVETPAPDPAPRATPETAPQTQTDADPVPAPVAPRSVRITYVAHSTFRIETEEGVTILTDFFGAKGSGPEPDVVTMNHAHETHYTDNPGDIPYVLRGWDHDGKGPADYKLRVRDVTIRNVTTDIRGYGGPEADGNSIFIFEVADLCIGHLGHLHHVPSEAHYAKIGRLDIIMAPVDGTFTLSLPQMIETLKTLKARVVLPMHAFGTYSLEQFLIGMSDEFAVKVNPTPDITVSLDSLPGEPTVLVLPSRPGVRMPSFGGDDI